MRTFVFARPRSGTHFLLETLTGLGRACLKESEFFRFDTSDRWFTALRGGMIEGTPGVLLRIKNQEEWWFEASRRMDMLELASVPQVFKVFPAHLYDLSPELRERLLHLLRTKYRCVVLERRVVLGQLLSLARSMESGQFYYDGSNPVVMKPVLIEKKFVEDFCYMQHRFHELKVTFPQQCTLYYEDIVANPKLISDCFGLEHRPVETRTKRHPVDYSWVLNMDAVKDWLHEYGVI